MIKEVELFGRSLITEPKRGLVDRIATIMKDEICSKRWKIGDRLPSLSELEQMTNLGRYPFQSAFQIL